MERILECPSCGAPLKHMEGTTPTIMCPFCGNSVVLSNDLRPAPPPPRVHPPHVDLPDVNPQPLPAQRTPVAGLIIAGLVIFLGGVLILKTLTRTDPVIPPDTASPASAPSKAPNADSDAFAVPVLKFGSEGIGPGLFNDARSVAVDAVGHIYVAEYQQRRVQIFDQSGKYINQWTVGQGLTIDKLVADRNGTVYIVSDGKMHRFDGSTGTELGRSAFPASAAFDDVAVTADGGLVTTAFSLRDDITRFDATGKTRFIIRNAVSAQSERPESSLSVAVDGLGNIYALSHFGYAVYKFSMDGKFLNKFGSRAEGLEMMRPKPGHFVAPQTIAVDGHGRVYVNDMHGIQVFDSNGQFIDQFTGSGDAMVFDDKNDLLIADRTQVVEYAIKK